MDLTKLFVLVETAQHDTFVNAHKGKTSADPFYKKVAFLQKTGEIMTAGQIFGAANIISAEELSQIQTALKGYLTGAEASNVAAAISALSTTIGTANTAGSGEASNATGLFKDIEDNKNAIATLNGDANTDGSVDKKIATAIAGVVASAPEAFDTLKEIADWITTGNLEEDGKTVSMKASDIIAKTAANEAAIGTKNTAGSGETSNATGLYKEIEDAVSAAQHAKTTVAKGTTDGTISVDGGADITIVDPTQFMPAGAITVTATSVSDGTNTFTKYDHPTATEATAAAVKVGRDTTGHVVIGETLTAADITTTAITGTDTLLANDGTTVSAQITNIQTDLKTIEKLDVWETYAGEQTA